MVRDIEIVGGEEPIPADSAGSGPGRTAIGIAILAVIAGVAWFTMEAGQMRTLVMVVLAGFAVRLLLSSRGSRYDRKRTPEA